MSAFLLLSELAQSLSAHPYLTLPRLFRFINYAVCIKADILLAQPADHPPHIAPRILPPSVRLFLSNSCEFPPALVDLCWDLLKETVWSDVGEFHEQGKQTMFLKHGVNVGIAPRTVYPGVDYCGTPATCRRTQRGLRLSTAEQHHGVLYTLDNGAIPIWIVHMRCDACHIDYHNNYSVYQGTRTYYQHIPDLIQVGKHQFVQRKLAEMWINMMVVSWTSATNCARLYNTTLAGSIAPPPGWTIGFTLTSDQVYTAFILLSLLDDHQTRQHFLRLPHGGSEHDRYTAAMQARSNRMRLYSQPEIRHYCKRCTRFYNNGTKKVSVVVIDGVTVGHPCCGVHNCHTPLASNRDRFCPQHQQESSICAIIGCRQSVMPGKRACHLAEHQAIEEVHNERGHARFLLQKRLQRAQVSHPSDAIGEDVDTGNVADLELDEEEFNLREDGSAVAANEAPAGESTKRRLRAQFGRKRTHNEEIIVAPCGMIFSRETYYGAEAVPTVVEQIKRTFRTPNSMPDHIFFDNNCTLAKIVRGDPAFKHVGLSVDVFHFNCKHSVKDKFCRENCDPAAFPELAGEGKKAWFFNSSIAEQTNVWLGGYHAICREMLVDKYNFFLDEMILRRNRMTKAKLEKEGAAPRYWPQL